MTCQRPSLPLTRSSQPLSPQPLTCAHSGARNSHLHSHRYSHGGLPGGAGRTPGSGRGSRGRRPHSLGHSNLQAGSESSGPHPSQPPPHRGSAGPSVFTRSPGFPPRSPPAPGPTWPAFAGEGLPEVSAVGVGRAGPRCTGVVHDTARFHVHSLAGRMQGRGPRRRGAEPYPL